MPTTIGKQYSIIKLIITDAILHNAEYITTIFSLSLINTRITTIACLPRSCTFPFINLFTFFFWSINIIVFLKVPFSLFMCKLKGFSFAYQKSSRAWFAWDGIIFFQYAEKDWYKDAYLRTSLQIKDCGGGKVDVITFLFWLLLLNKPKLNFFALHSLLSTATLRYKK